MPSQPPDEATAQCALQQVYRARAVAEAAADEPLQAELAQLVHVKYDRALECPVPRGGLLPADLVLHPCLRDGGARSLDGLVHGAGGLPIVLLTGSWT